MKSNRKCTFFYPFRLNPAGRTDVVGGPHAARGPQVARDWFMPCHRQSLCPPHSRFPWFHMWTWAASLGYVYTCIICLGVHRQREIMFILWRSSRRVRIYIVLYNLSKPFHVSLTNSIEQWVKYGNFGLSPNNGCTLPLAAGETY